MCLRNREYTREKTIRACVHAHSPIPKNGNKKIKTKQEYVQNGPFSSIPVRHHFFCFVFFILFFDGYHTVCAQKNSHAQSVSRLTI